MRGWKRLWDKITGEDLIRPLAEENARTAQAFSAVVGEAPEGAYFRTLYPAVVGSHPYGQPVDFVAMVRELAKLEQRIADIEDAQS